METKIRAKVNSSKDHYCIYTLYPFPKNVFNGIEVGWRSEFDFTSRKDVKYWFISSPGMGDIKGEDMQHFTEAVRVANEIAQSEGENIKGIHQLFDDEAYSRAWDE